MPKTKAERLKEYIEKKKKEDSISRRKMYDRLKRRERQRKEEQNFDMNELKKLVEKIIQKENRNSNFGKKQKKDIKGMIKKILLYGGLPTLLVVSLGILSNKKVTPSRVKNNTKVKVSHKEELFKKKFVEELKEGFKKKKKEINKMSEKDKKKLIETIEIEKKKIIEEKKNEIDYIKREKGRNVQKETPSELRANAAEERIQKEKILTTPLRQNSSNPQQSHKTPSKEGTLEPLERRKQKGMSSNKKLNNTNMLNNTNILNTNKQILKDSTKDSTNNTSDEKILTIFYLIFL